MRETGRHYSTQPVQRYAVVQAELLYAAAVLERRGVGPGELVVQVQQIGMAAGKGQAVPSGGARTGIGQADGEAPGLGLGNHHPCVDLVGLLGLLQGHLHLFALALVGYRRLYRQGLEVGRLTLPELGQAGADIGLVITLQALHRDFADDELHDL